MHNFFNAKRNENSNTKNSNATTNEGVIAEDNSPDKFKSINKRRHKSKSSNKKKHSDHSNSDTICGDDVNIYALQITSHQQCLEIKWLKADMEAVITGLGIHNMMPQLIKYADKGLYCEELRSFITFNVWVDDLESEDRDHFKRLNQLDFKLELLDGKLTEMKSICEEVKAIQKSLSGISEQILEEKPLVKRTKEVQTLSQLENYNEILKNGVSMISRLECDNQKNLQAISEKPLFEGLNSNFFALNKEVNQGSIHKKGMCELDANRDNNHQPIQDQINPQNFLQNHQTGQNHPQNFMQSTLPIQPQNFNNQNGLNSFGNNSVHNEGLNINNNGSRRNRDEGFDQNWGTQSGTNFSFSSFPVNNERSNTPSGRNIRLVNCQFYTDRIVDRQRDLDFTIIGWMGLDQFNSNNRNPIYLLNFKEGVERLVQNGLLRHTDDWDGIDYYQDMYRRTHEREYLQKWGNWF